MSNLYIYIYIDYIERSTDIERECEGGEEWGNWKEGIYSMMTCVRVPIGSMMMMG